MSVFVSFITSLSAVDIMVLLSSSLRKLFLLHELSFLVKDSLLSFIETMNILERVFTFTCDLVNMFSGY